ncbi:hypothetical protein E2C01_049712 [Portunus trituberculatus]|uniref:Uncharacterized protein n=1 Tax=Portunus trituberculatus TaxID=210409 RepID=A0A5B7GF33_PORTR|nr:hypothetical protein [Portunus trituberculatus]
MDADNTMFGLRWVINAAPKPDCDKKFGGMSIVLSMFDLESTRAGEAGVKEPRQYRSVRCEGCQVFGVSRSPVTIHELVH